MQHFVIQRQSAEPKLLCWRESKTGGGRGEPGGRGRLSAGNRQDRHGFVNRGDATLPPPVAQLPEAASLTEPVESLLLDELQDLRLNSLPQLAAARDTEEQSENQPADRQGGEAV